MKCLVITGVLLLVLAADLSASQSVITEASGSACMGDDKSRKETEQLALKDAKRQAAEYAATYIRSETRVKDAALESDLISAYANARVAVLQELEKGWHKDAASGDCFGIRLKVEVTPDQKAIAAASQKTSTDDPAAPLSVKVWSDRKAYKQGERIKIFLKANKPFYGRVVYRDAGGKLIQLLPNPFRRENYFNGGVVYELPGNGDRFDLEVTPPFGPEGVTVYAATAPLGEIETAVSGGVYEILGRSQDVGAGARGVKIGAKGSGVGGAPPATEFAEAVAEVTTAR